MKRLFVLVALFGVMAGLKLGQVDILQGAADPLTLASIGFTALFAFTVGEIINGFGLPRVTGYILTGVVLGPSLLALFLHPEGGVDLQSVLSDSVVEDMKIFNTLALGLIATQAGLELDIGATRKVIKTLSLTVGLKVLFLVLLVGGTFIGVESFFHLMGLEGNAVYAFALLFSVLGIGTSPAIALAVINDLKARGRMTDLLLAMAVVKDVVVVVCLAIAVSVAKALLSGGDFDPHSLSHVAQEIGGSILCGAVVGGLIIAYIRFIHTEMLLFVVATILIVARLSVFLHLELLLVFIVAGFLVRNFSRFEHELMHPLEMVALPVFVVFFTTAGASIDLQATLRVLPMALALFAARLGALALASVIGGRLGGEGAAIQKMGWLTYIPQAGVTLGLVLLTSGNLTEHAAPIMALGMALVALNLLVGPVTLGLGLKKCGDVAEGGAAEAAERGHGHGAHGHVEAEEPGAAAPEVADPLLSPPAGPDEAPELPWSAVAALDPQRLREPIGQLLIDLQGLLERGWIAQDEALDGFCAACLSAFEGDSVQDGVRIFAAQSALREGRQMSKQMTRQLREASMRIVQTTPQIIVPMRRELLAPGREAPVGVRARAAWRRMAVRLSPRGRAASRRVQVRTISRVALEGRMIEAIGAIYDARLRAEARVVEIMRLAGVGKISGDQSRSLIESHRAAGRQAMRVDAMHHLRAGAALALEIVDDVDSPWRPADSVSYAQVEEANRARRQEVLARVERWTGMLDAQAHGLRLETLMVFSRRRLGERVDQRLLQPIDAMSSILIAHIRRVTGELDAVLEQLAQAEALDAPQVERLLAVVQAAFDVKDQAALQQDTADYRQLAASAALSAELERLVDELPESLVAISTRTPLHTSPLEAVEVTTVPLHGLVQAQITEGFLPLARRREGAATELINAVPPQLADVVQVASYAFELVLRDHESDRARWGALLIESTQRARDRLQSIEMQLLDDFQGHQLSIASKLDEVWEKASAEAHAASARERLVARPWIEALRSRTVKARAMLTTSALRAWAALRGRVVALTRSSEVESLRIRTGLVALDPAAMRQYLGRKLPALSSLELPSMTTQLFALNPVDDRRLFVGRQRELAALDDARLAWQSGSRAAALIEGSGGVGKSSLVNMFVFGLTATRLIRLDVRFGSREAGPIAALAAELKVPARAPIIRKALESRSTVVVIDGLERWFQPTLDGARTFQRLIDLMAQTGERVLWIVSVRKEAFERFERMAPWASAFSHRINLDPFDRRELQALIESRQRLSGIELVIERRGWRTQLSAWGQGPSSYYAALARSCQGNPRAALYLHARSVIWSGKALKVGAVASLDVPFLEQLTEHARVILIELLRLGSLTPGALEAQLMIRPEQMRLELELLNFAGLIEQGRRSKAVRIPIHLREALRAEFIELRRMLEDKLR